MSTPRKVPTVLTIAGSDSSGGAGIEADLKVITAHQCYGMTAITALTAQNTQKVHNIHHTPVEFFKQSLEVVLGDIEPDTIKTGMLGTAEHVRALVDVLGERKYRVVVDPVMISTTGSTLLPNEAIKSVVEDLLPLSYIVTPNYPEALLLAETAGKPFESITNVEGLITLAKHLHTLGPAIVFLKGGHCAFNASGLFTDVESEKETVADIFYDGTETIVIKNKYITSDHTHGTGCSLSSAIASQLALGEPPAIACQKAVSYVSAGIALAPQLGKGKGPINHLHSTYTLPYPPNGFVPYLITHPTVAPLWRTYTTHPFVTQLGANTLPPSAFQHYLVQDYLFLIQFARANALQSYKSATLPSILSASRTVLSVEHEMTLHLALCKEYGIAAPEDAEESLACTAYTRYVLDIGASQDRLALMVAMASCAIGYMEIGQWLAREAVVKGGGNRYWRWVEMYSSVEYAELVAGLVEELEVEAKAVGVKRVEELVQIFARATALEGRFWGSALEAGAEV